MTRKTGLLLLVFLLVPCLTFSQTPRSKSAAANASWQSFYSAFRAAVNKRDRAAMLRMMPDDFFDGGGSTASEWLQYIDENAKKGSWRDLQKSFARGTVINRKWSREGIPTRVTRDNGYYFEYRRDKRWYFAGVVGD